MYLFGYMTERKLNRAVEVKKEITEDMSGIEPIESVEKLLTKHQAARLWKELGNEIIDKIDAKTRFAVVVFSDRNSLVGWLKGESVKPADIGALSLDEASEHFNYSPTIESSKRDPSTFVLCIASYLDPTHEFVKATGGYKAIETFTCTLLKI